MSVFIFIVSFAALAITYAIGKRHGWVDAQTAWREQRAPLPPLSDEGTKE